MLEPSFLKYIYLIIGLLDSMVPVLQELYPDNKEELIEGLQRHSVFYNTEPQVGAVINGISCGLEEERANGAEISGDMINSIKIGLMGPIAGIGDAMVPGMLVPLLLSISMGLAENGSIIGPIFYVVTYIPLILFISKKLFNVGYNLGTAAVDFIVGEVSKRLRESFNLLGTVVIGGVAGSYVGLNVIVNIPTGVADEVISINDTLNGIFPGILPMVLVLGTWWLLAKKNLSPFKTMAVLVVIALVGVFVGVL